MATGVSKAHFDSLRTIAAGGISAAYAPVGAALSNQVREFCITNNTMGDMIFSFDPSNATGNIFVKAQSYKLIDVQSNINPQFDDKYVIGIGERFYVKQNTAPVSGDIWIECMF